MEENVDDVSVVNDEHTEQVVDRFAFEEEQELRDYYLKQFKMMHPVVPPEMTDNTGLATLQRKTTQLIEMLTLFNRPWVDEITVIQKAVLQYLATEGIPKKERQRIIEVWGDWTTFLIGVSRYRGLLTRFLQYHHRQANDLGELLKQDHCL